MESMEGDASTLERRLTVVKVAKPNQDMRFDRAGDRVGDHRGDDARRSQLPFDRAGRTLLFDRGMPAGASQRAGIALWPLPADTWFGKVFSPGVRSGLAFSQIPDP